MAEIATWCFLLVLMSLPGARTGGTSKLWSQLWPHTRLVGFYSPDLQRLVRAWALVISCVARAVGRWLRALLSPLGAISALGMEPEQFLLIQPLGGLLPNVLKVIVFLPQD